MVEIAVLQNELDSSLREEDLTASYNFAVEMSDICSTHLYIVDKHLRDAAGEICTLSGTLLKGG